MRAAILRVRHQLLVVVSLVLSALRHSWCRIVLVGNTDVSEICKYTRGGLYTQGAFLLACLACFQLWPPIPTIAIGYLAAAAVIVAVRAEHKFKRTEQVIWLIIAFGLFYVEARTTYTDRDQYNQNQAATLRQERESFSRMLEQEKGNFEQERQTFGIVQQVLAAQAQAAADLSRFTKSRNQAQAQASRAESLPEVSLKKRASGLSAEIFSFLAARQAAEPRLQFPMTRDVADKQFSDMVNHLNETMALYAQKFASKVMSLRDDFLKQGVRDPELDQWYEQPTNTYGIERVAGRLGVLADRLRE